MAGHYFYDPRPYYGLNMSSNLMPLDELFYKYEPVPYWMDQRMAPMVYSDYHPGHVKQVMTRAPELQQFLPYNRPELAVRDDTYTDVYKRSPHYNGLGPYPEMRQPRGQSQDDTWLHTMAPQYANPQTQFPLRGYGTMPMPVPMGYMGNTGAYMSNQNFATQNYNGGEQYGQMEVGSKGFKNQGSNQNSSSKKSSSNDDGNSNKSNKNMYNNDASYGSKQVYSNDDSYGTKSNKKQTYNDDNNYGSKSKQGTYNDDVNYSSKSKKGTYSDDDNYGSKSKKGTYNDDVNYSIKSKKGTYSDDDNYSSKSKKGIFNNDDGYGTKSSKKMYSNDDNYSTKSSGNTNYGKQGSAKQQKRYTNEDSSSDDDEDEYRSGKSGGKWGIKPLLKHGKGDAYSHSKNEMGSKKSGNSYGGSDYQSYGANNMVVYDSGKKPSGQKHGSHSKSSKTSYHNGADTSSDDDDYAYTKKASKAGLHSQGVTKVQHSHSHGHGHGSKDFVSHVPSYGQQPKHMQLYSQSKAVELKVPLCCDNCERKVLACLERVDGVQSVLCDQWQKKVIVYGNVKPDVVLKKVRRVKKASDLWQQQQQQQRVLVY